MISHCFTALISKTFCTLLLVLKDILAPFSVKFILHASKKIESDPSNKCFQNLNWKFGPVNDQYANIEEKHPIKTSNLNLTKDPPSYSTVVVKNEFKNVPVSSFEIA